MYTITLSPRLLEDLAFSRPGANLHAQRMTTQHEADTTLLSQSQGHFSGELSPFRNSPDAIATLFLFLEAFQMVASARHLRAPLSKWKTMRKDLFNCAVRGRVNQAGFVALILRVLLNIVAEVGRRRGCSVNHGPSETVYFSLPKSRKMYSTSCIVLRTTSNRLSQDVCKDSVNLNEILRFIRRWQTLRLITSGF